MQTPYYHNLLIPEEYERIFQVNANVNLMILQISIRVLNKLSTLE